MLQSIFKLAALAGSHTLPLPTVRPASKAPALCFGKPSTESIAAAEKQQQQQIAKHKMEALWASCEHMKLILWLSHLFSGADFFCTLNQAKFKPILNFLGLAVSWHVYQGAKP